MTTFIRTSPMPKCKYCGVTMEYYILGMPDSEHCHPECCGKAMAQESIKKVNLNFNLEAQKEGM